MKDKTRQKALEHAKSEFPREMCGLVVLRKGRESYFPCRNDAQSSEHFILNPEDYAAAEDKGEITAIIHSHPNASANPSEADRVSCEASGVVWHIVGLPSEVWKDVVPCGYKAPMVGREFHYGVTDCFTLVQDWYRDELGIQLDRVPSVDGWWKKNENFYVEKFDDTGLFEKVTGDLQRGDVILMNIGSDVANHTALYLGDGVMLHHLYGRLSTREIYGGYYVKHTVTTLRLKETK